jgi:hypothetical protein
MTQPRGATLHLGMGQVIQWHMQHTRIKQCHGVEESTMPDMAANFRRVWALVPRTLIFKYGTKEEGYEG